MQLGFPLRSVTPLPHQRRPHLGISTMVIHLGALPLNCPGARDSQGQRKQWLYLQLWRECWRDLGRGA